MRVGKVIKVEDFPQARKPAYKLWIDFGDLGVTRFAQIQNSKFKIQNLISGVVVDDGEVVLIQPEKEVPLGKRVL
ncbi:hypothetical protein SD80_000920 [Scytonema tolypothrichoides VB-61278]|nr:hypothetical protein SD80_000920 [Scytonema tolypothrichoides VB-61278]